MTKAEIQNKWARLLPTQAFMMVTGNILPCSQRAATGPYPKVILVLMITFQIIYSYVEIKCQLDATEVFIADLIACSTCFGHHYAHHQELKIIIQWLLSVVFRAVVFKLLVWCGAEGYMQHKIPQAATTV